MCRLLGYRCLWVLHRSNKHFVHIIILWIRAFIFSINYTSINSFTVGNLVQSCLDHTFCCTKCCLPWNRCESDCFVYYLEVKWFFNMVSIFSLTWFFSEQDSAELLSNSKLQAYSGCLAKKDQILCRELHLVFELLIFTITHRTYLVMHFNMAFQIVICIIKHDFFLHLSLL